jgi:hypothetical protein
LVETTDGAENREGARAAVRPVSEAAGIPSRHCATRDVGRTLERLEAYEGIAILATNRKENIDDAFRRRLRYVVDFSVG